MSATDKGAAGVETEGERPVREQLKNAKIDALHEEGTARPDDDKKVEDTEIVEATEMTEVDQPQQNGTVKTSDMSDRGRLPRKRSFDDIETPGKPTSSSHRRKRSRDSTNEDKASIKSRASLEEARQGDDGLSSDGHLTNGSKDALPSTPPSDKANESTLEDVASPKTKRSRLEDTRSNGNEESVSIPAQSSQSMSDAPEVKDSEATAKDVSAESETTTSVEKADVSIQNLWNDSTQLTVAHRRHHYPKASPTRAPLLLSEDWQSPNRQLYNRRHHRVHSPLPALVPWRAHLALGSGHLARRV